MQPGRLGQNRIVYKGNEFIGTGIPSLDAIIGGGFPVGSLVLINEDEIGRYSDLFLQVFLAQGIQNKDSVLFASCDDDTNNLIQNLPQVGDSQNGDVENETPSGSMQIAWRYETSYKPRVDISKHRTQSNNFYFRGRNSKTSDYPDIVYWPNKGPASFCELEKTIISCTQHFFLHNKTANKKILRIAIHHIGSVFWENKPEELPQFFYKLRCLSHLSRAVIFITLPQHLINEKHLITRCEQISDIVLDLESLDTESNPFFNDYNGLIKFTKVSPINSLSSNITEGKDWAFKLLKKKIFIERITLPPELSTSVQREQDTFSCSSNFNKSIQF